jgi:hypothetical protein
MKTKKNKVTNLLKTGILFFGISLLLWNCEQETVFDEIQETPIGKVYKFEPQDIPNISSQIENRSRKNVFSRSSKTTESYWIDEQNILGAIDTLGNKSFFYRLYFNNMPSNTSYNIVVTERVNNDVDPFVLAYEFENGIKKSMKVYGLESFLDAVVERENKKTSNRSFNRGDEYSNEPIDITDCGDLLNGNSGGDSSNNNSGGTGTATDQNGPTNSGNGNYVSYGSTTVINYGGGNSGGGSSIQWGTGNFDFPPANALKSSNYNRGGDRVICPDGEIIIVENVEQIINELTGKADCTYNKLLSSGVSNFHNMITDLFIEFGDNNIGGRNLTFKMSNDLSNNIGGETKYYGNGEYGILINEKLMNILSSIEVAAILVHEIAHAFLGKHYNDSNSSFTELYEKYINDTKIANYSHDIMKDQFINRMATALRNYDSSIFSSFDDYKTLASQGVFELTSDQKSDLLAVKLISRNNDTNCD